MTFSSVAQVKFDAAIERHPILTITLRILSLIFYGIGALGFWIGNWFEERSAEMKKR